MSEQQPVDYSNICRLMRDEISKCDLRIKETEENTKRLSDLQGIRESSIASVDYCIMVLDSLKPLAKDIQEYITDKRKNSRSALNNALRVAGEIIPASMRGITFETEGDEAWLQAPNGAYVDRSEGSGYKGTTSVFLRSVVLSANPDKLQTLFLDEPLAKLSDERTALLSQYLPAMIENQQVILIEQKKEIYANAECTLYGFFKSDGYTSIVKE